MSQAEAVNKMTVEARASNAAATDANTFITLTKILGLNKIDARR